MSEQKAASSYAIEASRNFRLWLAENRCAIGFSTYQHGALLLIGLSPEGRLTQSVHRFSRCMGLHADGAKIWASSLHQLWRFSNNPRDSAAAEGVDRVYSPRVSYVTGDMDIHEMAEDAAGRLIFVNTLFSCLATPSHDRSFDPVWHPPFISRLAAEDRCHLNGLAMRDGQPGFVSALAATDVVNGWRDHRTDGGVLLDVASGETVAAGLSMPHSPRWAFGKLWFLNSGEGSLCQLDLATGQPREVAFCPGYARGISMIGRYAVIGLSRPRREGTFGGLPLADRLDRHKIAARCGLIVVDLDTGSIVEWVVITGSISEIFDVAVIPDTRRPIVLGDPKRDARTLVAT